MRSSNITISFLLARALLISSAEAAIHYVDVNSTNPVPPYLSWDMAAVTIQDAETSSIGGDEILVTNGVYQSGSSFASRISIGAAKFVHSVNGPDVTVIQGYQPPGTTNGSGSIRCAFLRSGVTLAGFTLIHGAAPGGGGGGRGGEGESQEGPPSGGGGGGGGARKAPPPQRKPPADPDLDAAEDDIPF